MQLKLPEIEAQGASLVAISPQLPDKSLSTKEKLKIAFEVLSDVGNKVARSFGLVFTLDEELRPLYTDWGADLPEYNGDQTFELPLPATYVIDRDGTIVLAFVDTDYRLRLDPEDIISALIKLKGKDH